MNKKAYLICPVRGQRADKYESIVNKLESEGWDIHFPPRDVDQTLKETQICIKHLNAMYEAERVFVIWDGKSKGCLFDMGMAWALGKPIECIDVPDATPTKSIQNMLLEWELGRL